MFNTNSISYMSDRYLKIFFFSDTFSRFLFIERYWSLHTVPFKKRNRTVHETNLTKQEANRTVHNFLDELISQATPPKVFHWLFKTKRIRQNDFVSISLISNFTVVDILLEHILTLFHFGFNFEILIFFCHRSL